jgi:hypothetical protein
MELRMSSRIRAIFLTAAALFFAMASAQAQNVGADEAVKPNGAVAARIVLTPAQKGAIYNAVMGERVRASAAAIPTTVGATVSAGAALADLPAGAGTESSLTDSASGPLKYAVVANDIVVVDPVEMRVVDVIHGGAKP